LDYTDNHSFLKTIAKHPSDCSKTGDVGHAWVYVEGIVDGEKVYLEGGHSGEVDSSEARYFDGVMNYIDYGYANPASYLWTTRHDGFFQWGNGDHKPTYAIKIDLTPEQFENILDFIRNYDFETYALKGPQCSSFASQVAFFGGLDLECEVTIPIAPYLILQVEYLPMWTDPCYAEFTVSTPDILERSMIQAVCCGQAEYALDWYRKIHKQPPSCLFETMWRFPERYCRFQRF
jgi:hypothetical protein